MAADSTTSSIYIHPQALCESSRIGAGTRVWAFAHVCDGAAIGRDCNLGEHVYVEAGAVIGNRVTVKNGVALWRGIHIADDAFIGPAAVFCNDAAPRSPRMPLVRERYAAHERWLQCTHVEAGASIGAGAVILPGVTIGTFAMIGAGSVVTRDVPAHRLVYGSPARIAGWACHCGGTVDLNHTCELCGAVFQTSGEQYHSQDD